MGIKPFKLLTFAPALDVHKHARGLYNCRELKGLNCVWTDPLVLSVLQPCRVVGHAQQRDDEVDHGKDAVEPQKVVPERHRNAAVTSAPAFSRIASLVLLFQQI